MLLLIAKQTPGDGRPNNEVLKEASVLAYRMECIVEIVICEFTYQTWYDKKAGSYCAKRRLTSDLNRYWHSLDYDSVRGFGDWNTI